ncbi:unnamed protein product [Discosporangium mesarthrocarpum]
MHPGWCDTPGLASYMADFHNQRKPSLRSSDEGADTIIWLAVSPKVAGQTGKFWFDRKAQRTHMPYSGTSSGWAEAREALWRATADLTERRRG